MDTLAYGVAVDLSAPLLRQDWLPRAGTIGSDAEGS